MVKSKSKHSNLIFRKLKISDYDEFKNLFYFCFKKKISFDFYKWRYFSNKFSFCYGAFDKSRLIANVGMFSIKLNNSSHERIFSRHSSMVLREYRGKRIFSDLLNKVKKKIFKKVSKIAMWPNKNNFSNFGIDRTKIYKKKYFLYRTSLKKKSLNKMNNYQIDKLVYFKRFIESNNNLFLKNYVYFKNRYLSYNKKEYFINKYKFQKFNSFFILKRNKDNSGLNYVILDHFGSKEIKSKHFLYLIKNQQKLIFLSKKKINKTKFKLINNIYLKIGFIKEFNLKSKKNLLLNKEIFLGDTDIFLTVGKD